MIAEKPMKVDERVLKHAEFAAKFNVHKHLYGRGFYQLTENHLAENSIGRKSFDRKSFGRKPKILYINQQHIWVKNWNPYFGKISVLIELGGLPWNLHIFYFIWVVCFELGFMSGHSAFRGLIELKFIVASTGGHRVIGHLFLPDVSCLCNTRIWNTKCQVEKDVRSPYARQWIQ